jgi:hypothetical protein
MSSNRSDYHNEIPQGSETPLPRHVSRAKSDNINVAFPAALINKAALLEAGVDVERLLSDKTDTPMTGEDEAQYQKLLEKAQKKQEAKPLTTKDTAIMLLRKFHAIFHPDFLDGDIPLDQVPTESQMAGSLAEFEAEVLKALGELEVEVAKFLEDEDLLAKIEVPEQNTSKLPPTALLSALYEPAPEAEIAEQQFRRERENFQARSKILETLHRRKGWTRYIWPDQGIPVEGGLDPDGSSDKGMGWFQRSKDRLYRMSTTGAWDVSVLNEETLIYHIVLKGTWDQETPEDFPK